MQVDAVKKRMKVASDFERGMVTKSSEPVDRIVEQMGAIGSKGTRHAIGFARHEPIDGRLEIPVLQKKTISNMPNQFMCER